ncbi:MAG: 3-hydroxyacyl-CoA dehydrogenase NAD-binding domain-containing protein [Phycisphaerales bacterium]|nr:3-hydroxyacyl-CoA dehydrogenase NAD-binding domain-containing protein [Phycisphaerales bacterium]
MVDVKKVAVIGAGTMGSGIALVAASSGYDVLLVDVSEDQLAAAQKYHAKISARSVEKERITQEESDAALARIVTCTDMTGLNDVDWVVEAATEQVDLKKKIFQEMASHARDDVVLATNTSSISITDLASAVPEAEDRVIGMHFFNPVPVMKLVEVIKGRATSETTTARTIALSESMGKTPIPANDFAGFVSNRVLMPLINEAFFAWEDGVADPEAIDGIMTLGCNFPMGPLRLADHIGLDVCRDIMLVMHAGLDQEKYLPCPRLVELVDAGRLGNKSGQGVYEYGN